MSNWPPTGTPSSGLPSYCDIRNPQATKTACIGGGGLSYPNNLCNIINPNTSVDQCNANLKTINSLPTWVWIVIVVIGLLLLVGFLAFVFSPFGQAMIVGVRGGSRNILKSFGGLKWK